LGEVIRFDAICSKAYCGKATSGEANFSGAARFRGEAKSFGRSSMCRIYNIAVDSARRAESKKLAKKLAIAAPGPYARVIIGFGSAADG
jgi:hypothetical protein